SPPFQGGAGGGPARRRFVSISTAGEDLHLGSLAQRAHDHKPHSPITTEANRLQPPPVAPTTTLQPETRHAPGDR
ncbi:MAG: hypothetical protein ACO1SX_03530, partial [Actinomycetota bacterium]